LANKKSQNKAPKATERISPGKQIRGAELPRSADIETPVWILSTFDLHGPWGVSACAAADCEKHLAQHLKSYESMTWAEILAASGGKSAGNNNHPIMVPNLSAKAKERLQAIKMNDIEAVFSLRLEATVRLYGIRMGRILKLLWLDPWHADAAKAVCPARKRHT
jgi:hypothetical protein